jgi:hypothetical protein
MTDADRRAAAKQFAADWEGRGDEKQETQAFWLALLQKVYGIEEPEKYVKFELPVKLSHTSFIDAYIDSTRVLIEQKGAKIDLNKGETQSDGSLLTPFQQARRYAGYLPHDQNPRWIVVCNFKEFRMPKGSARLSTAICTRPSKAMLCRWFSVESCRARALTSKMESSSLKKGARNMKP